MPGKEYEILVESHPILSVCELPVHNVPVLLTSGP